jgi:hypothetical protein
MMRRVHAPIRYRALWLVYERRQEGADNIGRYHTNPPLLVERFLREPARNENVRRGDKNLAELRLDMQPLEIGGIQEGVF